MITLFATKLSGHGQRVEMLLKALALDYDYISVSREYRRQPAFLKRNPFGQIPVLEDGEKVINDSHAILVYLAKTYDKSELWLPDGPYAAANVQRWLSVSAGEIAHGLALSRAIKQFGAEANLADCQKRGRAILDRMDSHLADHHWLASDDHPTIADLACYGYVSTSPEGGIAIEHREHILRWLAQIEAQSYWVPIPPVDEQKV